MGSDSTDIWRTYSNEWPRHNVEIDESYDLGKYEVTQAQWYAAMKANPSDLRGDSLPVTDVSWDDVQKFLLLLNEGSGCANDGPCYRLPTEAEWEYAACMGERAAYGFGNDASLLDEYAWYDKNSNGHLWPVGKKKPNEWGLYDMHGNVWEWTESAFRQYPYQETDVPDSLDHNTPRVVRGGSWLLNDYFARCAFRYAHNPNTRYDLVGFRVVLLP